MKNSLGGCRSRELWSLMFSLIDGRVLLPSLGLATSLYSGRRASLLVFGNILYILR